MYPDLLHIGPVTIYSFGVMAALALVAAAGVAYLVLRTRGVPFEFAYELFFAAGLGGFAGARIYYMLQHWDDVKGHFISNLFGGSGFNKPIVPWKKNFLYREVEKEYWLDD